MSDVLVREARPDEADAVGGLTVAAYEVEGFLRRPDGGYDDEYAAFLAGAAGRAERGVLLVAVDGDTVLGTVTWCPPGSVLREISTDETQAEIRTLAVGPDARGRGVGALLVDDCLARARAAGVHELRLSSLPEMVAAHRLYTRRGFVRRPDLDWSPFPDVVLWGFSLTLRP